MSDAALVIEGARALRVSRDLTGSFLGQVTVWGLLALTLPLVGRETAGTVGVAVGALGSLVVVRHVFGHLRRLSAARHQLARCLPSVIRQVHRLATDVQQSDPASPDVLRLRLNLGCPAVIRRYPDWVAVLLERPRTLYVVAPEEFRLQRDGDRLVLALDGRKFFASVSRDRAAYEKYLAWGLKDS